MFVEGAVLAIRAEAVKVPSSVPLAGCTLAVGLLAVAGCWNREPPAVLPQAVDADAARKAMELYDANKDGFLDDKELEKVPSLKAAKSQLMNKDQKIGAEEIAARIESWKGSGIGRLSVMCKVTHNGRPLENAVVTFVPESFLGSQVQPGSGTTNRGGMAIISGQGDVSGMSPGFYRVQITKAGEKIPPKYNTETTLGQEVAGDAEGINSGPSTGLVFDLKY